MVPVLPGRKMAITCELGSFLSGKANASIALHKSKSATAPLDD